MEKQIMVGVCFDEEIGAVINSSSPVDESLLTDLRSRAVESSIIRLFESEETKDAYMQALDDCRSNWILLNVNGINFINQCKHQSLSWQQNPNY